MRVRYVGLVAGFVAIVLVLIVWRQAGSLPPRDSVGLGSSAENVTIVDTELPSPRVAASSAEPKPDVVASASNDSAPSPKDFAKLQVLDEVLASRNDNDPRLDIAFRDLTPGTKQLFREKYSSLAPEKLNERGTVVFLLGRSLSSPADAAFLARVAGEKPCLSLTRCDATAPAGDAHGEMGVDITLAYPQVVALKSFESYLKRPDRRPELVQEALRALQDAQHSPSPIVARTATEILRRTTDR